MSAQSSQTSGPFSIKAVLAMVIVGIVAFSAFLVLLAFADDLRSPDNSHEHAQSQSAVGFAGIARLLDQMGHVVRINRGTPEEAYNDGAFVVLSPPAGREITWQDFYAVYANNLVVLPKWNTRPNRDNPLWVDKVGLATPEAIEATVRNVLYDVTITRAPGLFSGALLDAQTGESLTIGPVEHLQSISGELLDPIITDSSGNIILGAMWDEDSDDILAYVLSDPDLINTHGLKSPLTARTAVAIFEDLAAGSSSISFDVTLHGMSRSRNMLQLALSPPFLPAVLCLAFAGVLVAAVALAGPPGKPGGRAIPFGKMTLVDNTAKLIANAGRNAGVAERYVAMTRKQAMRALGLPSTASDAQQSAMLDALRSASPDASRYSDLAGDVAKAKHVPAILQALQRMYKWKQELGRERSRR